MQIQQHRYYSDNYGEHAPQPSNVHIRSKMHWMPGGFAAGAGDLTGRVEYNCSERRVRVLNDPKIIRARRRRITYPYVFSTSKDVTNLK